MPTPEEIAGDWRLQGNTSFLENRTFTWKAWFTNNPSWDHDHCDLCTQKITNLAIPGALHEGYVDEEDYHWICAECARDLHVALKIKLMGGPAPSWGFLAPLRGATLLSFLPAVSLRRFASSLNHRL